MKRVIIIGGGAAGMMTAASIASQVDENSGVSEMEIILLEKNDHLGAKVLISGGGRCNVTTGIFDVKDLLQNYPRGAKFLISAMYHFPPEQVMAWFEMRGVKLKTEADLRVFPVSNNGEDIVNALKQELKKMKHVVLKYRANVVRVKKEKETFYVTLADGTEYQSDILVITTGGNAYRKTGSTGDGYDFAKTLGHTITPLAHSLNSFKTREKNIRSIAGVSFEKCQLTLKSCDKSQTWKKDGPLLFTHLGVTGPAVFALSAMCAYENYIPEKPLFLSINFFPEENGEQLKIRFEKALQENTKKGILTVCSYFLPKSLIVLMLEKLYIDPQLTCANVSKKQKNLILHTWQNFELHVVGRGAGDEFVTAGGVSLQEVHTNTMESKLCENLYFAGEILDVDGFTGGYNLQASWAMGNLVGESIGKK